MLPILIIVLLVDGSLAQFNRFPQFQQPFQPQQQQQQFRIPRQQATFQQQPNQIFNNVQQQPQVPQRPFQQSRPFQAMAEQVRQTRQQTLQANAQQPFRQPTAQPVKISSIDFVHVAYDDGSRLEPLIN
jgi:hypothetical protein